MNRTVNARTLRQNLAATLQRAERGERLTVVYRSRAVCRLVPLEDVPQEAGPLAEDPLYKAGPLGRSTDGLTAADHDRLLYGGKA